MCTNKCTNCKWMIIHLPKWTIYKIERNRAAKVLEQTKRRKAHSLCVHCASGVCSCICASWNYTLCDPTICESEFNKNKKNKYKNITALSRGYGFWYSEQNECAQSQIKQWTAYIFVVHLSHTLKWHEISVPQLDNKNTAAYIGINHFSYRFYREMGPNTSSPAQTGTTVQRWKSSKYIAPSSHWQVNDNDKWFMNILYRCTTCA